MFKLRANSEVWIAAGAFVLLVACLCSMLFLILIGRNSAQDSELFPLEGYPECAIYSSLDTATSCEKCIANGGEWFGGDCIYRKGFDSNDWRPTDGDLPLIPDLDDLFELPSPSDPWVDAEPGIPDTDFDYFF